MQPQTMSLEEAYNYLFQALGTPQVHSSITNAGALIQFVTGTLPPGNISVVLTELLEDINAALVLANIPAHSPDHRAALLEELQWRINETTIKLPKNNTKYDQGKYLLAFEEFCFMQAVYDLTSGKLHRLDPVIGDQGCQWRVPFVLDLHDALLIELENQKIDVSLALSQYEQVRQALLGTGSGGGWLFDSYNFCRRYSEEIDLIKQDEVGLKDWNKSKKSNKSLPPFLGKSKYPSKLAYWQFLDTELTFVFENTLKNAPKFAKLYEIAEHFMLSWKRAHFTSGTAKSYLVCNKIISLRRIRKVDRFGLSSVPEDIDLPLADRIIKSKYIELAALSHDYMKYVAYRVYKAHGLNDGTVAGSIMRCLDYTYPTLQGGATYNTHLFFGPLRLLFMHQYNKGQPIIIDHRRLKCTLSDRDYTYTSPKDQKTEIFKEAEYEYIGGAILYFEPDMNGNYVFVPNPNSSQINKVGMCVETYSVIANDDHSGYVKGEEFFLSDNMDDYLSGLTKCSIVDLIMFAAALHPELPMNCTVGDKRTSDTNVTLQEAKRIYELSTPRQCTKPGHMISLVPPTSIKLVTCETTETSILVEKNGYLELLTTRKVKDTEYRHILPGREHGRRVGNTVPFAVIHIYGCTYAVKCQEYEDLMKSGRHKENAPRLMTDDENTNRPN